MSRIEAVGNRPRIDRSAPIEADAPHDVRPARLLISEQPNAPQAAFELFQTAFATLHRLASCAFPSCHRSPSSPLFAMLPVCRAKSDGRGQN
jgi:hypothetical protein